MKKFLTLLLVVLIGLSFAGCNDSKNALASNIENSVSRLSKLIDSTKEINNNDILIKEIHSTNGNYTDCCEPKTEKNSKFVEINEDNNEISSTKIKNLNKKIKNMPRKTVNTQIVRNNSSQTETSQNQEILTENKVNARNFNNVERLTTGNYKPRRISNVEYNNAGLQNYISKIEDLYLMMNDASCANNECNDLASILKNNCNALNDLCKQLKNNKIELNDNQMKACNDLLGGLNKNLNTLNNSKNDIQTQCKEVKKINVNPNANVEQISTKYIKLINCLDDKITCYSNILSILTQLKCTISGVCEKEDANKELNIDKSEDETPLEHIPQTLPYFPPEDLENQDAINNEKFEDKINQLNQNAKINIENKKIQRNRRIINPKRPTSKDRDESITLGGENQSEKIADFSDKSTDKETERKNNLDTFKDATVKSNIIKNKSQKNKEKIENSNENTNNFNENMVNNQNLPNNTDTTNGVNGTMINGVNGTGINTPIVNGAGNNIITNGYGIHNYENGITNPYRNTDTYKFPLGNKVNNAIYNNGVYPGIAKIEPLPQETRQNFKTFN